MKGFKVICLECGVEMALKENETDFDKGIGVWGGHDGSAVITCGCGNPESYE